MTLSADDVTASLTVIELTPKLRVPERMLKQMLPNYSAALFFAKAYKLNAKQLAHLLSVVFQTDIVSALVNEGHAHSSELQGYLVDTVPDAVEKVAKSCTFNPDAPIPDSLLVALWESANVAIATSIAEVVSKLDDTLSVIKTKEGVMLFDFLSKLNKQRNSAIGTYAAQIRHKPQTKNLVVFDVSGSMSSELVTRIAEEVVALAYNANASLALVSNTTRVWDPGQYSTRDVTREAEYGGTQYETLAPLFDEDWDVVITIADYDSSYSAKSYLEQTTTGKIHKLLDISVVDRPTFLAECLGHMATEIQPLLLANGIVRSW